MLKAQNWDNVNYHVYHHLDADGYGAAATLNRFYLNQLMMEAGVDEKDECKINCIYYPCDHGEPMDFDDVQDGDCIFILDYSFSRQDDKEALIELQKRGCQIIWIDHHDTSNDIIVENDSFKQMAANGLVYTGTKFSGAMLTYIWCKECANIGTIYQSIRDLDGDTSLLFGTFENIACEAPRWIRLISDHDTFTHELSGSDEFVLAVTHHGLDEVFIDDFGNCFSDKDNPDDIQTDRYIKDGKLLKEFKRRENEKLYDRAGYVVDIDLTDEMVLHSSDKVSITEDEKYTIAVFNGYGNSSVFGDYFSEYDACALYHYDGKQFRFSLYSHKNSDCDCGRIAKMFGEKYQTNGGGHKHAAGWSAPINVFDPNLDYVDIVWRNE